MAGGAFPCGAVVPKLGCPVKRPAGHQWRSQTNQSHDIPEGILDLADSTTVLNFERSAVDSGTSIDELPGHRIERIHGAGGDALLQRGP